MKRKVAKLAAMLLVVAALAGLCLFPASAEEKYPMRGYTEDQAWDDAHPEAYFVKSPVLDVELEGDGTTFYIGNLDPKLNGEPNAVWYASRAQIELTPYLIIDVGNEGDPEVGPRMHVEAYWLDYSGQKKFMYSERVNGMGKVCFALRDDMLRLGDCPNGMNITICHVWDAADPTTAEKIKINEMYLSSEPLPGFNDPTTAKPTTTTQPSTEPTQPTSAPTAAPTSAPTDAPAATEGGFPVWAIVAIAAGVVVIAAVIIIVIVVRKKKR